jgi:hypothetical protein
VRGEAARQPPPKTGIWIKCGGGRIRTSDTR